MPFRTPRRDANLNRDEKGRYWTAAQLWNASLERVAAAFALPGSLPHEAKYDWELLADVYGHVTTVAFLEYGGASQPFPRGGRVRPPIPQLFPPWTNPEILMFGVMENQLARLNNSVLALIREYITSFGKEQYTDEEKKQRFFYLQGGMDQLPLALYRSPYAGSKCLQDDVIFGAKLEEIEQHRHQEYSQDMRVVFRNAAQAGDFRVSNRVILAVPFPILRHVKGVVHLSPRKQRAIQALNYTAAGKIMLQCRKRFWEDAGIYGGRSQTDQAICSVWYPQHGEDGNDVGRKHSGRGILLASYTWSSDAEGWGHLPENDRIRLAVAGLRELHKDAADDISKTIEGGVSVMWQNEEFAGGAFALFNPRQEALHTGPIRRPEGLASSQDLNQPMPPLIHFAGEHTCPQYQRWIEGAVDSGLRAAWEIHTDVERI